MTRILPYAGVAVLAAALAFCTVIIATPYVLMAVAMKRLSDNGARINTFVFAPRTTSASRAVVRPSPDLAYAACVFDLAKGPLRVRAAPWGGYMSISVFAADSDNIFAVNDRQAPAGVDFILARPGQATPPGAHVVLVPSVRGIILDRRLAPDDASFARADAARRGDICEPLDAKPVALRVSSERSTYSRIRYIFAAQTPTLAKERDSLAKT